MREAARYRVAHGVRDGEARLGIIPMGQAARAAFKHAAFAVQDAKRVLGQRPMPVTDVGRGQAGTAADVHAGATPGEVLEELRASADSRPVPHARLLELIVLAGLDEAQLLAALPNSDLTPSEHELPQPPPLHRRPPADPRGGRPRRRDVSRRQLGGPMALAG